MVSSITRAPIKWTKCILTICIIFILMEQMSCAYPKRGKLLVKKEILNELIFTDQDTIIKNTIYNIGNKKVENITLCDLQPEYFSVVAGKSRIDISMMEPNEILTHLIVVRPKISGMVHTGEAQVKYSSENTEILSYSTKIEGITVKSEKLYYKMFSYNKWKWLKVSAVMVAAIFLPFVLWKSTEKDFQRYKLK